MTDLVCISPVDGKEYARRAETPAAEAEQAIERARQAQRHWREAPLGERCDAVARFLAAMERMNPQIVPELAWQMGRPVRYGGEFRSLKERVEAMVALAPEALADDVRDHGRVVRIPAGLVMVIAPWNYPYLTAANTIVPALLAGNAVILKHSAQTLLAGERFAEALPPPPVCRTGCSPTSPLATRPRPTCSPPVSSTTPPSRGPSRAAVPWRKRRRARSPP
jgi:acyl-CoA reductase-like NAD-dependent aldehyde dehydrogenase